MQFNRDFSIDRLVRISLIFVITYLALQLLYPVFGILAWSFILTVALYPIFIWINVRIGNRPVLSATIVTVLCFLLMVGTLALLMDNLVQTLNEVIARVRAGEQIVPEPSLTVKEWPLIGDSVYQTWAAVSSNAGGFVKEYSRYLLSVSGILLGKVANKGVDLLLFMISVVFSGYLMTNAPQFMRNARKLADKVALERGTNLINLMKETIQNVSRGVIGIAILQTMLFGMVLLFANVPAAGLLSFIALLLCIIQAGLFLVIIPVMVWVFYAKSFYFAVFISVLLFMVLILDSILKPLVLARGLSTPMMIIFLGLIGGLMIYGLIGVFIGPIVLAIFYDMLRHWLND